METKLQYLFRRLRERIGDHALTPIMEQLYNLIILEKDPPSRITKRLSSKRGRRSKIERYLHTKSLQEAQRLLEEDLKEGRISRRTYYRAKKLLTKSF